MEQVLFLTRLFHKQLRPLAFRRPEARAPQFMSKQTVALSQFTQRSFRVANWTKIKGRSPCLNFRFIFAYYLVP